MDGMSKMKIEITKRRGDGTFRCIRGTTHGDLNGAVGQWQWRHIHDVVVRGDGGYLYKLETIKEIMEAEVVVTEEKSDRKLLEMLEAALRSDSDHRRASARHLKDAIAYVKEGGP